MSAAARPNSPPSSPPTSQPGRLPDHGGLRERFAPDPAALPEDRRPSHPADRLRGAARRRQWEKRHDRKHRRARLTLILNELRLPAIKQGWSAFAERADKEGWPAARFLATLAEHEIAERDRRRIERHLVEARLLPGKTLDSFDFEAVPMISKAHVMAICAGDSWIDKGANLILIGGPGGGKTHLASAIGLALVENGWRVLFARTSDLVQRLQVARRELALEAAINRLDRFHLLILDDLAYVSKIRQKPPSCSSSSAPATNAAPPSSPPISRSAHGARSSQIPP